MVTLFTSGRCCLFVQHRSVQGTSHDATLPDETFTERFEYEDRRRQTVHVSFEGVVADGWHWLCQWDRTCIGPFLCPATAVPMPHTEVP